MIIIPIHSVSLAPQHIHTYINRDIAYSSLDNHQWVIEDYDSAIAINPDSADAYYARGFTLALQEERKQAAITLNPYTFPTDIIRSTESNAIAL